MSEEELVSRLKVEAEDKTGEVMRGISERIEKVKRSIEAMGTGAVLGKAFSDYAQVTRTMEQLGIQTRTTAKQVSEFEEVFKDLSDETGISLGHLAKSFYNYVALSGQAAEVSIEQFKTLAGAAKITGIDVAQLSRAAAGAVADMKLKPNEVNDIIKFWTIQLPVAMLEPFTRMAPRLMQIMEAVGYTGKKNAEEMALVFGEVTKSVGFPRLAFREINSLLYSMQDASTKLGGMMLPVFEQVRQQGGGMLDMFDGMYKALNRMHAFDPRVRPFLREMFGIDFDQLKALQTIEDNLGEIRDKMKHGETAAQAYQEVLNKFNKDPLSAMTHLRGAVDNLELSFGQMIDTTGGTAFLEGLAKTFDDVTKAVTTADEAIQAFEGKGKAPPTGNWTWKQWSSAIGKDIFETTGGVLGGIGGSFISPGLGTVGGALAGIGAGRAAWEGLGEPDLGQTAKVFGKLRYGPRFGGSGDVKALQDYAKQHGLAGPEQHATGGIITRPTLTTAGEDGPEAIIPLSGGTGTGGGSTKANTEAVKENTAVLKRLLLEGQLQRGTRGLRAAYTPAAGELPTPADAELYGGVQTDNSGNLIDGSGNIIVPSARLASRSGSIPSDQQMNAMDRRWFGRTSIHVPNPVHGGQVPHAAPSVAPPSASLPGLHPEAAGDSGLAEMREPLMQELERDPETRRLAMQMMATEGGAGHGQAALEALFNRTLMIRKRIPGWTLKQELNSGFYGPINRGAAQRTRISGAMAARYNRIINSVGGGSDMISGRTDQGMVGDPNWRGPGRVNVGGSREIYNFWHGRRGHVNFNYEDSAAEAAQIEAAKQRTQVHQQMLDAHRRVRQEMERPIQLNMRAPLNVGARQRMSSLQSRWLAQDMMGVPRYSSQLDIGFA